MKTFKLTLAMAAVAGFGLVLFCRAGDIPAAPEKNYRIWTEERPATPQVPPGFSPMQGFAPLVDDVKPAVVNIYTTTVTKGGKFYGRRPGRNDPFGGFFNDPFFERFFGGPNGFEVPPQKRNSLGSGVIINADGYVLTNNHVVAEATEIRVKLDTEKEYDAEVVGRDEKYDLALLKVKAEGLPIMKLGDSDDLKVGDWVVAIGNPFGLSHTVTAGIVSAKDRVIGAGPFDDFIQTDASINPGNSGGPLFTTDGLVVGINTAIHSGGQGIGFAVPVNMAKKFIRDVLTQGRVVHGWLGVGIQDVSKAIAKHLELDIPSGVLVSQVYPDSPAEKAGMKRGDVIVAFNGRKIERGSDLTRLVGTTSPGSDVRVKVIRDGSNRSIQVRIGDRGDGEKTARGQALPDGPVDEASGLGLEVTSITRKDAKRLGLRPGQGVLVGDVDRDGPAAETGIRPGDVIAEVNRVPVGSPREFTDALAGVRPSDSILMLLVRGPNYFYAVVKKP
ncbi:MAG: DegQ family serine endoprotease [Deltaproteobacteria bacterium]|nr:DegQ family serine endoprotease [Deltaproteobacteria bacterium]